jgi:phosphoesterase RecJ-like protein
MNYNESEEILNLVKNSKKVLLNCHNHPDPDSIGSATSMYEALKQLGVESEIFCPSEIIDEYKFIPNNEQIKLTDYEQIVFDDYDLLIIMDSSNWERVCGSKEIQKPDQIRIINIDNHKTNTSFGQINLLKPEIASTCEMLWGVYKDWGVEINKNIAMSLLAGIYGDTGGFRFRETSAKTLEIAADLMRQGADHNVVVYNLYRSLIPETIDFFKFALNNYVIEERFVWFSMNYDEYSKAEIGDVDISDFLLDGIKDKEFGVRIIEKEPGVAAVSFRARSDFDVSKLATTIGGGGHQGAAGARVSGDFMKVKENILQKVRDEINK